MPWFHLSENPDLPAAITDLHEPKFDYLDVDEPCFCVSPTVWQCIPAINADGLMFIYDVHVNAPIPASDTADFDWIQEHRITQQVLDDEGGAIALKNVGRVEVDQMLRIRLKRVFGAKRMKCDAAQERQFLWEVDGEIWKSRTYQGTSQLIRLLREG